MNEGNDPRPAMSPEFFWRVLVAGNVTSLAVLLFAFNRMMHAAASPELGVWLFLAGAVLILPSFLYRNAAARKQRPAHQSDNAHQLVQLNRVVIACGLAELPGLLGAIYYLFAREWGGTALLLAVTAVLLLQARPRG